MFSQGTHTEPVTECAVIKQVFKSWEQVPTSRNRSRASNNEEFEVTAWILTFWPLGGKQEGQCAFSFPILIPKVSLHIITEYYIHKMNHKSPFKRHVLFSENYKNWPDYSPHSPAQTTKSFSLWPCMHLALRCVLIGPRTCWNSQLEKSHLIFVFQKNF